MSLFGWLKGRRKREDEAALRRAADDYEGTQADEEVGLLFGETADEPKRLAERDDE